MALNHNILNKITDKVIKEKVQEKLKNIIDNVYIYNIITDTYAPTKDEFCAPKIIIAKSEEEFYLKLYEEEDLTELFFCNHSFDMQKYSKVYEEHLYDWMKYIKPKDQKSLKKKMIKFAKTLNIEITDLSEILDLE